METIDALAIRGEAAQSVGDLVTAEQCYREVLAQSPNEPEVLALLGNVLAQIGHPEEAIPLLRRSLALEHLTETSPIAHMSLALCLSQVGENKMVEAHYLKALAYAPKMPAAMWNYGYWLLQQGRYEGFAFYQWGKVGKRRHRRTLRTEWDGRECPGETLFVWAEQGFGDTLMFLRFLEEAKAQGKFARVILEVQKELVTLLEGQTCADVIYRQPKDQSIPYEFDQHCSLADLPYLLEVWSDADVETRLYIKAPNPVEIEGDALKVGFCWKGNPAFPGDALRSLPSGSFSDLMQMDGVNGIGLIPGASPYIMDDWRATANLVASLDLVITTCTAVAHLAGAMGRPVWILLPFFADWRWQLDREDSPWYSSARLFRQPAKGDWDTVLEDVRLSLKLMVSERGMNGGS